MKERSSIMSRMFLLLGLLLLIPAAILVQLVRVGYLQGEGYRELWSSQAISTLEIQAERGQIFDENGALLASNRVTYKIAADPYSIDNREHVDQIAKILSRYSGRSEQHYRNAMSRNSSRSRYVVLHRNIPVEGYEELAALGIRGLILEEEYRRLYNFESLAAHVIGFVNHNLDGMAGLEKQYNEILKGSHGEQQVRKDRYNKVFAYVGAPKSLPQQGFSLHTTINSQIQSIVEEELETGIERHKAQKGTAIIMDPRTGAIKAMANFPTYNPNSPGSKENENRKNFAVADMIEPGSTFKLVTAISAVEQNAVEFGEMFETPENGVKMIHGQFMRDHDPLGTLSFTDVIAKSSNIATSEIAMRLKPDTFFQYARNMGFGTPTHIDLPGEESGRLQKPFEWSLVTLPWMSIGYEVQATPLQILQAYAAFANGGQLMQPYIVNSITNEMGDIIEKTEPHLIRKIARESTIDKLKPVFEKVVSDSGTAGWASIEGLRIAGKTGTAQKFIDGQYRTKYNASFVGFFPVDNPEYIILVLLDEPRTSIYGGFTAGSIFKEIAKRVSSLGNTIDRSPGNQLAGNLKQKTAPSLLGLSLEQAEVVMKNMKLPFEANGEEGFIASQEPTPGSEMDGNTILKLELESIEMPVQENYSTVPDLSGLSMRQATNRLLQAGLDVQTVGSGTVFAQFPKAGERMQKGRPVTVRGKARSMYVATTAENQQ
jgi:cell division protein FtsI (penicillin-binding protein 3)